MDRLRRHDTLACWRLILSKLFALHANNGQNFLVVKHISRWRKNEKASWTIDHDVGVSEFRHVTPYVDHAVQV
jgi:hypothetical protein